MSYWLEASAGVRGDNGHKGSWLQARDQGGWGFATMSKRPPFQVREHIFLVNNMHPLIICFILCVLDKKGVSLCRLKINHALGAESCIYSWCTGLHGSKQLCLSASSCPYCSGWIVVQAFCVHACWTSWLESSLSRLACWASFPMLRLNYLCSFSRWG